MADCPNCEKLARAAITFRDSMAALIRQVVDLELVDQIFTDKFMAEQKMNGLLGAAAKLGEALKVKR